MHVKKLVLQTAYPKTLQAFYSSMLELPVRAIDDKQIEVNVGRTSLLFVETTEKEPFYHFAINIPCNKIEEAKAWLSKKLSLIWIDDYKSDVADFVNWHARSVYFYDPGGNILELIARFDLANETLEAFSSKQLLSISEVGLVFEHTAFDSKTAELLNNHQLYYFAKQPPLPQFRAIGNDEGLFIAVPENRNWYPTGKAAAIFPMTVEFRVDGSNYISTFN